MFYMFYTCLKFLAWVGMPQNPFPLPHSYRLRYHKPHLTQGKAVKGIQFVKMSWKIYFLTQFIGNCVYVYQWCICIQVHMCTHVWRPEVAMCCPQSLHLFLSHFLLMHLELMDSARLAGQQGLRAACHYPPGFYVKMGRSEPRSSGCIEGSSD